mmetsp:Transcript_5068/g.14210  ORF Transcript_5068/g.14210 Transcript_5068/m.14210 type:complete len:242 (-) Transcript_5068:399-1124(-)
MWYILVKVATNTQGLFQSWSSNNSSFKHSFSYSSSNNSNSNNNGDDEDETTDEQDTTTPPTSPQAATAALLHDRTSSDTTTTTLPPAFALTSPIRSPQKKQQQQQQQQHNNNSHHHHIGIVTRLLLDSESHLPSASHVVHGFGLHWRRGVRALCAIQICVALPKNQGLANGGGLLGAGRIPSRIAGQDSIVTDRLCIDVNGEWNLVARPQRRGGFQKQSEIRSGRLPRCHGPRGADWLFVH